MESVEKCSLFSSTINCVSFPQVERAPSPISMTLLGIKISCRLLPPKAPFPIWVTLFGIESSFNERHPAKAFSPICVILSGNESAVSELQALNVSFPI